MGDWLDFKTDRNLALRLSPKSYPRAAREYACIVVVKTPNPARNRRRWQEKLSREDFDGRPDD
jgi:hypothetical protein